MLNYDDCFIVRDSNEQPDEEVYRTRPKGLWSGSFCPCGARVATLLVHQRIRQAGSSLSLLFRVFIDIIIDMVD